MPINDKLNRIKEIKGNIKDAIVEKGVEVTDTDSFNSYADKIRAISGGGGEITPDKPTPPETPKFVKPDDWIDIREGIPENAIRFLITDKYFSDANKYDIVLNTTNVGTSATINWGDGTQDVVNGYMSTEHKFDKAYRQTYIDEYGFEHGQYMIEVIFEDLDVYLIEAMIGKCKESALWCVNNYQGVQEIDMEDATSLICYETLNKPIIYGDFRFRNCYSLKYLDVSNWDISRVTSLSSIFSNCYSLTYLDVSNWDTSSVTSMSTMFYECYSLTYLDVSNWDTSSVTDMGTMFNGCYSLTYLDVSNWDVSNVTNMYNMFYGCYSLTKIDVSNWDTSSVTDMKQMFYGCYSLTKIDVSNWDTSSVTILNSMFCSCYSLTYLDVSNWDTSSVTDMTSMFLYCQSLDNIDVSNWDTSSVTDMSTMFQNCHSLKYLDISKWNINTATNIGALFNGCKSLRSLNRTVWDLSLFTGSGYSSKCRQLFLGTALKELDIIFPNSDDFSSASYLPINTTSADGNRRIANLSLTIPRPTFAHKITVAESYFINYDLQHIIIKGEGAINFTAASPQITVGYTRALKEDAINEFFTNLPTATNSPTISLKGNPHAGYANMGIALEKGWNVLYDSTANSASTTPLGDDETPTNLPLAYRFIPEEDGTFVDANGNKCNLLYSQSVATMNPTGWEMLPTFEDALNKYGIEVEEEYREEIAKEVLAYANDDSLIKRYNIELD